MSIYAKPSEESAADKIHQGEASLSASNSYLELGGDGSGSLNGLRRVQEGGIERQPIVVFGTGAALVEVIVEGGEVLHASGEITLDRTLGALTAPILTT